MDRRLIVLAAGMFAVGTDSFVVAGVLPQISRSFHVSIGAAGQLTTVYALVYAVLAPLLAAVAAHAGRKKLMLWGLGLFVVSNLATAFAPIFAVALAARASAALGAAMYAPTAMGSGASITRPEKRGFALSVVIAGLTFSTAFGSPLGTVIGGLGDWRWTMIFVSAVSVIAGIGITFFLKNIPMPPAITLKQRMAPFSDHRVGLTLLTTLLTQCGTFVIYTYFSVIFDRAIRGNPLVFGTLLVALGVSATVMNLLGGRLIDRIGSRKIMVTMLLILLCVTATLSWTSAALATAIVAVGLYGATCWGQLVPQQHRLVTIMPTAAPIVLGLNTSITYVGAALAGIVGAGSLTLVGAHELGWISFLFYGGALIASEAAHRSISRYQTGDAGMPPLSAAA